MKKLFLGALFVVAAAIPARAQGTGEPNPMVQQFRSFADQYRVWLTMAFDSIPESMYGYRPTKPQQTVGYIAQHLEAANYRLCAHLSGQERRGSPQDLAADSVRARWPKDTLVARLKASLAYCDAALARLSDSSLADPTPLMPPNASRYAPRIRFLLLYVTDLSDHWSQIANYMRLNGLVPPSALPRSR